MQMASMATDIIATKGRLVPAMSSPIARKRTMPTMTSGDRVKLLLIRGQREPNSALRSWCKIGSRPGETAARLLQQSGRSDGRVNAGLRRASFGNNGLERIRGDVQDVVGVQGDVLLLAVQHLFEIEEDLDPLLVRGGANDHGLGERGAP